MFLVTTLEAICNDSGLCRLLKDVLKSGIIGRVDQKEYIRNMFHYPLPGIFAHGSSCVNSTEAGSTWQRISKIAIHELLEIQHGLIAKDG